MIYKAIIEKTYRCRLYGNRFHLCLTHKCHYKDECEYYQDNVKEITEQ